MRPAFSAQCTDARVNLVTPALFAKYPTLEDYCNAQVEDVEQLIHSCGFYHGKARDIIAMAQKIRDDFDGKVPDTMEGLTSLQGVGRKTANLILGDIYKKPAVVDGYALNSPCEPFRACRHKRPV